MKLADRESLFGVLDLAAPSPQGPSGVECRKDVVGFGWDPKQNAASLADLRNIH